MHLKDIQSKKIKDQINQCSELWKLNPSDKVIYRIKDSAIKERFPFLKQKMAVEALYRWIQHSLSTTEYLWLNSIIERDQISIRDDYPRAYKLLDDWTISHSDLKTLKNGPLFDSQGVEIVKYASTINLLKKLKLGHIFGAISFIAAILTIYTFFFK